ncbi:MAG: hypothetical protein LUC43_02245, partial [Burkholderiales bacterium]|nr:hypothetical protein [Burkholderiales bacterium]
IEKAFELTNTTIQAGKWELLAIPKDLLLKNAFDSFILKGNQSIDEIMLKEKTGDLTKIIFTNQQINKNVPEAVKKAFSEAK